MKTIISTILANIQVIDLEKQSKVISNEDVNCNTIGYHLAYLNILQSINFSKN